MFCPRCSFCSQVALELISRPDLDDSLLEGLELLQCVATATPDIVQRAKALHYDLEGMIKHRTTHQNDQIQQAVQQLLVVSSDSGGVRWAGEGGGGGTKLPGPGPSSQAQRVACAFVH